MRRLRIIHSLRTIGAIAGFLAVGVILGMLWWANRTGLPDAWRDGIADALAKHGIHARIASLRYTPFRGFEADEVVVYSDEEHRRVVARFNRLLFDLDRTKLTRGDFQVERLDLSGASFSLAVDPEDPESKSLDLTRLGGRIEFSGDRRLNVSDATGMVRGIRVDLDCDLDLFRAGNTLGDRTDDEARAERRRILLAVIDALDACDLKSTQPPRLRIDARGDLEDPGSLRATLSLQAADLAARDLTINNIDLRGEIRGPVLVIHHANVSAETGTLEGKAEYDLVEKSGRFELRSDLGVASLLERLEIPVPENLPRFASPPAVDARGDFHHEEDGWNFAVVGHAELDHPTFLHFAPDHVASSFSWDGSQLLLEDLVVEHGGGRVTGRAFIQPDLIRYEMSGSLPLDFVQRTVTIEPLHTVLNSFSGGPDLTYHLTADGHANPHDKHDWHFNGTAEADGIAYNGVPTRHAKVTMALSADLLDFTKGEVTFDYRDYPLRKRHGGPSRGVATVGRIAYEHPAKIIRIEDLAGTAWPAPIVRTFAPEIADHLEDYGFHRTPELTASGIIGIESGLPRQDLAVRFRSEAGLDYKFLDETLELDSPRGVVRVLPDRVLVEDLRFGVFDGDIRASLVSRTGPPSKLSGAIDWTELDLEGIGKSYKFKSKPPGRLTGRADFTLTGQDVKGLDAEGHIALEKAQLFDVPVLGPLSPVIAAVLGNRRAGFQEANSAFCTFRIRDGVMASNDFLTTTRSLVFTGDGRADLNKLTLDMTIRMNARGLLGVITLPLRPFYGLFQFAGTGPLDSPEWRRVMFTSPPPEQELKLMDPPKARAVPEAPPRAKIVR